MSLPSVQSMAAEACGGDEVTEDADSFLLSSEESFDFEFGKEVTKAVAAIDRFLKSRCLLFFQSSLLATER